jgi:acyl carrier protein
MKKAPKVPKLAVPAQQQEFYDHLLTISGLTLDECTEDSSLEADLGCDSLDVIEFTMLCEEAYKVSVDEEIYAERLEHPTVGDMLTILRECGAAL